MSTVSELVDVINDHIDQGNVDGAVARRDKLRAALPPASRTVPDAPECLARVTLAELDLIAFDGKAARAALGPYLDKDGIKLVATRKLQPSRKALVGRLLSVLGNLFYRERDYDRAAVLARSADDLFGKHLTDPQTHGPYLWNLACLARSSWRVNDQGAADGYLSRCLEGCKSPLYGLSVGRRASVEAFALDIWANMDWARGWLPDALRKIYRALFLLGSGVVQDQIRLGTAPFSAGKIESTFSVDARFTVASGFLERSQALLKTHPLLRYVDLLEAQILVKTGKLERGSEILDKLQTGTSSPAMRAEIAIVRTWILERSGSWPAVLELMEATAVDTATCSPRVRAESAIQLGRAKLFAGDHEGAIGDLQAGLACAASANRPKTEALACLELVRACQRAGKSRDVTRYWTMAGQRMSSVRSLYLERLRDLVAREDLGRGWSHTVGDGGYEVELDRFREEFLRRARDGHDSDEEAAAAIGLDKRKFQRELKNARARLAREKSRD